jgi:hypothetical protein
MLMHANEHPARANFRLRKRPRTGRRPGGFVMSDLVYIGLTIAFFALAAAFAWFCEKVR